MLEWVAISSTRGSSPPRDQVDSLLLNHLGSPRGRMVWLKNLSQDQDMRWEIFGRIQGCLCECVCICTRVTGPQLGDGSES